MDSDKMDKIFKLAFKNRILKRVCGEVFIGVFARDKLPRFVKPRPALLVVNTDPSWKPGEHWVAMYLGGDDRGEYFDSMNDEPHSNFVKFMDYNCTVWTSNRKQLQSVVSRFCGHYCIAYCALRFAGVDVDRFCNMFSNDTGLNDVIAHAFVCKR